MPVRGVLQEGVTRQPLRSVEAQSTYLQPRHGKCGRVPLPHRKGNSTTARQRSDPQCWDLPLTGCLGLVSEVDVTHSVSAAVEAGAHCAPRLPMQSARKPETKQKYKPTSAQSFAFSS